jgi:hypothetical protein
MLLLFILIPFVLFKALNAGVRLSDTNVYFYTAHLLLQGKMLYRDIFFTNLPLFPYIAAFYKLITGGNIVAFYATSALEAAAVAFFLHKIALKKYEDYSASLIAPISYLFSFIVLSTSDHQTGVFAASLFTTTSYWLYLEKRTALSGIFMGATLGVKAYFLPILLADLATMSIKRSKHAFKFMGAAAVTIFLIILPSLLFARSEFFQNLFGYSLSRPAGLDKLNIVWFFVRHDPLLVTAFIFSIFSFKKNPFLALVSIFSAGFILVYRDVYYLYLNMLVPYLALGVAQMHNSLTKNFASQTLTAFSWLLVGGAALFSILTYLPHYSGLQKFESYDEAVAIIKKAHPKALYGAVDITPALAYGAGVPLLDGVVDTNPTLFRRGILDAKHLTAHALKEHAIIVATGVYYPRVAEDLLYDEVYVKDTVKKHCRLLKSFPVTTEGAINRVSLLNCN